jgi:hypothetical protein
VNEVGLGFLSRRNSVVVGETTVSQAAHLGKDEPHPMTLLAASVQFGENLLEDRLLSIQKPL